MQGTEGMATRIANEKRNSQLRLARLFGAIFTANMLTWLPMVALALTGAVVDPLNISTAMYSFAYLSFLSETVIHPILEAFLIKEARETLSGYLSCCKRKIWFYQNQEATTLGTREN